MLFASLLCFALFGHAIGLESFGDSTQGDDAFLAQADAVFATKFPLPYKILDLIRVMLEIPKDKMMKFAVKLIEIRDELQELWKVMIEMFRKETPKARISTTNQQYLNKIPSNTQFYYGY